MNKVYDTLRANENIRDKLTINESHNLFDSFNIDFNEFLRLTVYVETRDPNYYTVELNGGLTHWHHDDDEALLQDLAELANGEVIFIENMRLLSLSKIKAIEKEKFEKKKARYFAKKCLRIYTGNSIIKRNNEQKKNLT